jgi:hypothetical protein
LSSALRLPWPFLTLFLINGPLASLAQLTVLLGHEGLTDVSAALAAYGCRLSLKAGVARC